MERVTGRNSELIRQWKILQRIASCRTSTIPALAKEHERDPRTIRRDLAALQAAGFPIRDPDVDGKKVWVMDPKALDRLTRSGLTFNELCALYFSRALFECFAGAPMLRDLQGALDKFEAALSPAMKKFLDRLPRVITVKAPHGKRQELQTYETVARLLDATMNQRIVSMRYHSQQSKKEKDYVVHPYRLVHAQGALYLLAFVPLYSEVRIFAVERVRKLTVGEQTFDPIPELDVDPFKNSLGVHKGDACKVQLRFHPEVAAAVQERTWHTSQTLKARPDGSVLMTLHVSDDYALRSWILGFGRYVRVEAPASLADWLREELEEAREQYGDGDGVAVDSDMQPGLPFLFNRLASV